MAREEIEETIDGVSFRFRHLGGRDALKLQSRVLRALGSNAAALQKVVGGSSDIGSVIGLVGSIEEDELLAIIDLLGKESSIQPPGGSAWLVLAPNVVDVQFAGRPMLLWKWAASAIKHQLADFFGGRPSA